MKKRLLAMSAIPALALAVPAVSQINVNAGGAVGIQHRIAQLHTRIDAGQGGPLDAEIGWRIDQDCDGRSSGIGSLFSGIFGGNDCMRVGERVRGNLFVLPTELRTTFRDRNGIVYRSDGREHIYEIDARTGTIVRVWERDD